MEGKITNLECGGTSFLCEDKELGSIEIKFMDIDNREIAKCKMAKFVEKIHDGEIGLALD